MQSEFPSNSKQRRDKPEKPETKKVDRVVEGDVVRRKKPLRRRMKETFFGGDAHSVWGFVAFEVLIPAAKDMFADAVTQGVERMIFSEVRSTSRRTGRRPGESHISYNRYSSGSRHSREDPRERALSRRARASHDFDEIILATRREADEVIERLFDIISQYDAVTVSDLYDLVGLEGSYTDNKWGWVDIRGAGVTRVNGGYLLDLPRPEPID